MTPVFSVILTTRDDFAVIRGTVAHLTAQTIADRLELVIVAPSRAALQPDETALRGLGCWQVVEAGTVRSVGHGNALGVRAARAPIVALAEDHAFPEPDWAAALVAAHSEPVAAVGPIVRNANPVNAVSEADFLISYGLWRAPGRRGPVGLLPGHNSSYKRAVLLAYGDRLETLLEAETVLHWDLRRRGETLLLEPAARVAHVNFARWDVWLPVLYHGGRVFAAARARGWPWWKRALFVAGGPVIPLVRLARLRPAVALMPVVLAGLVGDAVGQVWGCALGAGRSGTVLPQFEFNRQAVNREGRRVVERRWAATPAALK